MFKTRFPLILASQSPRRKEILQAVIDSFTVQSADVDEQSDENIPEKLVVELAKQKARAVFAKHQGTIVIGADTVVSIDAQILGKPKDESEALSMLKHLSGKTHTVYTGVCVCYESNEQSFFEATKVTMGHFDEDTLSSYIQTGEPMDKAGAYGIQGIGGFLVERIEGDYLNVVGLPLHTLVRRMKEQNLLWI